MERRTAIIIGAGPAGLTAAYELATRSEVHPVVLEKCEVPGGISRTVEYAGNRIDIGGHRFFSKSDRVMGWWLEKLPVEDGATLAPRPPRGRGAGAPPGERSFADPAATDRVFLLRMRKSRIYYLRKLFDYPVTLGITTLRNLGMARSARIGLSYLRSLLFPIRPAPDLESFFINRFGRELYRTFFKDYTEKVWGVPCREIDASWGAQRIKELSVLRAISHFARRALRPRPADVAQKELETSLIERFLYPKLGPGQMWEETARLVVDRGGELLMHWEVIALRHEQHRIRSVAARNLTTGEEREFEADFVVSSMPLSELVLALDPVPPPEVAEVASGLVYRDFVTVGLLVDRLEIFDETPEGRRLVSDHWIYIQEPHVKAGRLQIFNNWSPAMVADPSKVWIGVEYFTDEGGALWNLGDAGLIELAAVELSSIGILRREKVRDGCVIRVPKAYPAYFGSYDRIDRIRDYLDAIVNLYPVGRNGMHRYNNQDHSMLTAMQSVDAIVSGTCDKRSIWDVNTENAYHERRDEK